MPVELNNSFNLILGSFITWVEFWLIMAVKLSIYMTVDRESIKNTNTVYFEQNFTQMQISQNIVF